MEKNEQNAVSTVTAQRKKIRIPISKEVLTSLANDRCTDLHDSIMAHIKTNGGYLFLSRKKFDELKAVSSLLNLLIIHAQDYIIQQNDEITRNF